MSKKALKDKKLACHLVEAIGTKNYSKANKYLVKMVESKIKDKINSQLNKPLF